MSKNIYNLRLSNGTELISEIVTLEDLKDTSPELLEVFSEDDVILSHPIIVHATPFYNDVEGYSGLDNVYTPFLTHARHGCIAIHSSRVLVIDDMHDDMIDQYVELVIAMYGHLYHKEETAEEPSKNPLPVTVH